MYSRTPVNKTAALIVNQSGCEDRIEFTKAEQFNSLNALKEELSAIAKSLNLRGANKGAMRIWLKQNPDKIKKEQSKISRFYQIKGLIGKTKNEVRRFRNTEILK